MFYFGPPRLESSKARRSPRRPETRKKPAEPPPATLFQARNDGAAQDDGDHRGAVTDVLGDLAGGGSEPAASGGSRADGAESAALLFSLPCLVLASTRVPRVESDDVSESWIAPDEVTRRFGLSAPMAGRPSPSVGRAVIISGPHGRRSPITPVAWPVSSKNGADHRELWREPRPGLFPEGGPGLREPQPGRRARSRTTARGRLRRDRGFRVAVGLVGPSPAAMGFRFRRVSAAPSGTGTWSSVERVDTMTWLPWSRGPEREVREAR